MFVKITVDPRGQKRVIKLKVLLLTGKTKTESWTELIDHPLFRLYDSHEIKNCFHFYKYRFMSEKGYKIFSKV